MIILHPKSGKVAFQPKELVGKGLKLWWQHFAQKKYVKHKSVIFFGVRQRDKEEEDFSSCHLRLVLRICYCSLHLYCISTICTGTVANGKYSGDEWYRNYRYVDQGQVANCTRKTYWSFIKSEIEIQINQRNTKIPIIISAGLVTIKSSDWKIGQIKWWHGSWMIHDFFLSPE